MIRLSLLLIILFVTISCNQSSDKTQEKRVDIPKVVLQYQATPPLLKKTPLKYNDHHPHYTYKIESWQLLLFKKSDILTKLKFNLHFNYTPKTKQYQIYIDQFSIKFLQKNSFIDDKKFTKKYNTLLKEIRLQGVLSNHKMHLDPMTPIVANNTLLRELTLWLSDLIQIIFLPLNGVSNQRYKLKHTRQLSLRTEEETIQGVLSPIKKGILFDLKRYHGTIKGIFSLNKQSFQQIHLRYEFNEIRTYKDDTYRYQGKNLFIIERIK